MYFFSYCPNTVLYMYRICFNSYNKIKITFNLYWGEPWRMREYWIVRGESAETKSRLEKFDACYDARNYGILRERTVEKKTQQGSIPRERKEG